MEAAWAGDLDRIKSLTLQAWGDEQDQPPLKMAINDDRYSSPFSLAFLRGHHDVARAILEIIKAQYTPVEEDKVRYKMENEDDGDEDDECSDEDERSVDSGGDPRIVSEKVDQNFTIDDIGHVSMQVKSSIRPLDVICSNALSLLFEGDKIDASKGSRSLFVHVMDNEDTAGLKALLDMAQHYAGEKLQGDDEEGGEGFVFPQQDFRWAVENGKMQFLGLIIKRTGAGMPLDHLVKKSGFEMKQKPRYYQGLTVYGKKRYGFPPRLI